MASLPVLSPYLAWRLPHWQNQAHSDADGYYRIPNSADDSCTTEHKHSDEHAEHEENLRLAIVKTEIFDTNAVLSALLVGFSAGVNPVSVQELDNEEHLERRIATMMHQWLVRCSTICAMYSMLVFMFSAMYGKEAAARKSLAVEAFQCFIENTEEYRRVAFWFMYGTSIVFCCSVVFCLIYSLHLYFALAGSVVLVVLICFTIKHTWLTFDSAGVVFMTDEQLMGLLKQGDAKSPSVPRSSSAGAAKSSSTSRPSGTESKTRETEYASIQARR